MVSRWFISFASIDRVASSSQNIRLRAFAKTRIALRVVIGIIISWSIIATHRLIFYEVRGTLCAIVTNSSAALYHSIYILLGGGVLPAGIMITCTILIRRNLLIKKKRKHQKVTIQCLVDQQKRNESMDSQVMTILYIQIVCYIILMTPQMCNVTFNAIVTRTPSRSVDSYALDRFIAFVAELMMYVFPVLSFYLYTLSSSTFRLELWQVLAAILSLFLRRQNHQVQPLKSSTQNDTTVQNHDLPINKHLRDHEEHVPNISATIKY